MATDPRIHVLHGSFVHTFYMEQFSHCPDGFRLETPWRDGAQFELKTDLREKSRTRPTLRGSLRGAARSVRDRLVLPNTRIVRTNAALVHSCQYLVLGPVPWVVDFEDIGAFVGYRPMHKVPPLSRAVLRALLAQSRCRALLPWTEAARRGLVHELGNDMAAKTSVVLPAIAPRIDGASTRPENLLFVGSAFVSKGGVLLLRAFERVRKTCPGARLDVVSFVPDVYRREAERIGGIEVHTRASPATLQRLFLTARALVAPFATDTLGFVVLEGFAQAVPAIVSRHFALPELVDEGITGLVVPTSSSMFDETGLRRFFPIPGPHDRIDGHPLIEELREPPECDVEALARAMAFLLEDRDRAAQMSDAALRTTIEGRFSPSYRKRRLATIYSQAAHGN